MDPVYQDELILGFQSMIDDKWSWGVRGIYRKLNNAIDDMEITSTGILCGGEPRRGRFRDGEPRPSGHDLLRHQLRRRERRLRDRRHESGRLGAVPTTTATTSATRATRNRSATTRRSKFMIDRAWDGRWSLNAVYTLSFSKGNAEGPVNSDTDFADTGRTEAFDDPWVNLRGTGYLPNDHRHQLKVRGAYALGEHWEVGTMTVRSGRPGALGEYSPYDDTCYWSFFIFNEGTGQYELHPRGRRSHALALFDLGANVTFGHEFSAAKLSVKLAVYNLLNQQRTTEVDDFLGSVPNGQQ